MRLTRLTRPARWESSSLYCYYIYPPTLAHAQLDVDSPSTMCPPNGHKALQADKGLVHSALALSFSCLFIGRSVRRAPPKWSKYTNSWFAGARMARFLWSDLMVSGWAPYHSYFFPFFLVLFCGFNDSMSLRPLLESPIRLPNYRWSLPRSCSSLRHPLLLLFSGTTGLIQPVMDLSTFNNQSLMAWASVLLSESLLIFWRSPTLILPGFMPAINTGARPSR